jgi:ParB-like chromosome segregation protein Spo0J
MSKKSQTETGAALAAAAAATVTRAPAKDQRAPNPAGTVVRPDAPDPAAIASAGASTTGAAIAAPSPPPATATTAEPASRPDYNTTTTIDRLVAWPGNVRHHRPQQMIAARALSIAQKGVLQSLLVRPSRQADIEGEQFEVIGGETRRLGIIRAIAGIADAAGTVLTLPRDYPIPIRVKDCDDVEAMDLSFAENYEHEPMEPVDEAAFFAARMALFTPAPGETRAGLLAARLKNVSERTITRRLRLRRLAPELAAAALAHEINIGQAEAFSLGDHDTQRSWLKRMKTDAWMAAPGQIKRGMTEQRIPADRALFDRALYTGTVVADDETGEEWFADAGEFAALQEAAIGAEAEKLRKKHNWVEIDRSGRADERYHWGYDVKKSDKEAGAVIAVRQDLTIQILAPALKRAALAARRKTANAKSGQGDAAARPPLTEAQVRTVHAVKTRALRLAVATDHKAALALACLGLLREHEIRGLAPSSDFQDRGREIADDAMHCAAVGYLTDTAALELPEAQRPKKGEPPNFTRYSNQGKADPALWFGALYALPDSDRSALFDRLLAERIGSWAGFNPHDPPWLGDSPLAVAIANKLDAAAHLPSFWHPDEAFFKACTSDRLHTLLRGAEPQHDLRAAKKGELVKLCLASRALTTDPLLYPELRFQTEAEAKHALADPLPVPAAEAAE